MTKFDEKGSYTMTQFKKWMGLGAVSCMILAGSMGLNSAAKAEEAMTKAQVEEIIQSYISENPEIIVEALNEYQRREQEREEQRATEALQKNMSFIKDNPHSPAIGATKNPELVVAEFFDYNCGYCKRAIGDIEKLEAEYGDRVKIVFKEYPIFGGDSDTAARLALAADKQGKYFEYHQALMKTQGKMDESRLLDIAAGIGLDVEKLKADKDSAEISELLNETKEKGAEIGVRGTPAFVIGDKLIRGAVGFEQMKEVIDSQLK